MIDEVLYNFWCLFQIVVGFNLIFPFLLFLLWKVRPNRREHSQPLVTELPDYAIIVTAYTYIDFLPSVVDSILSVNYDKYHVYVVADNCPVDSIAIKNERVSILYPAIVLKSNTKSHQYAMDNFVREHDYLTIIDSDNLVHKDYFINLNHTVAAGFEVIQGLRAPKNIDTTISALDAARDIYYHFYDGKLLFEVGSSATLSGSGMAFKVGLYRNFLKLNSVTGAGFDKVLQFWIVQAGIRISFNENAIVYDEKTSNSNQLVEQRARWINTWFKYSKFGFSLFFKGLSSFNTNQILFGLVLLRPPLFIFILISLCFLGVNLIFFNLFFATAWFLSILLFILSFQLALVNSNADERIYKSLKGIPKFMYFQVLSLIKSKKGNEISVSTNHKEKRNIDQLKD